ncbi:MAG: exo-beta-N-acetylmuramidase NamZ domain-containing protein [Thermoanaerobaculales bacterium]
MSGAKVQPGIEVLLEDPTLVRGRRIGVLANQAGVTRELVPAWRALTASGATVVRLFAPEHGLWGVAQDMEAVGEDREPVLGVPVVSLYGAAAATLEPRPEHLAGLDALVVDLPDVGCRVYTFAATLAHVLRACEAAKVETIVCDRPNPIGGLIVEGGPVEPRCRSFVSELPVPLRHGMTMGELALLLREERHPRLALAVLPCRGWHRGMWWDETDLPWVAPSPNMPTLVTATIYPGACLVEATNLSEGRGTTRPFQLVGAPWLDGDALADRLNGLAIPGVRFRPTRFRPEFGKHAGMTCGGVEWHVTDRHVLRPVEAGVRLLATVREMHPDRVAWRQEAYEFVSDVPAIDVLTGSARAREAIEGRAAISGVLADWDAYCREFGSRAAAYSLYPV